jgi:drug/metabolite transporter (DMT)-like permease
MPTTSLVTADRGRVWLGLATLYGVWGSTYLAIAVAIQSLPPFLMAATRFALAGVILLGWMTLRHRREIGRPSRTELRDSAIVGALLLGGGMGLVAWGEQSVPSGITAVVVALMPVWVAVFGRWAFGERLPRVAILGVALGFSGVALLAGPTAVGAPGALDAAGLLAIIVSPIAWSIGSLYASHRARLPEQPLVATGLQRVLGSVVLLTFALATGEPARFDPSAVQLPSVGAFLYLTVVGSFVAFTTYGWMLRVAPLQLVATYAYVNPVIAVILGAIILGEPIEPRTIVAGAIIVSAVALIVTARSRMTRASDQAGAASPPPGPPGTRVAPTPSRSASG